MGSAGQGLIIRQYSLLNIDRSRYYQTGINSCLLKGDFQSADNIGKQLVSKLLTLSDSVPETNFFLCPQRNFGRHIVIALSVRPSVSPVPLSCPVHISYIL